MRKVGENFPYGIVFSEKIDKKFSRKLQMCLLASGFYDRVSAIPS